MVTKKESADAFANKAKGKFDRDGVYEDTLSPTEAMRSRGYEYVDGRWR